jgi:hypothetical protein
MFLIVGRSSILGASGFGSEQVEGRESPWTSHGRCPLESWKWTTPRKRRRSGMVHGKRSPRALDAMGVPWVEICRGCHGSYKVVPPIIIIAIMVDKSGLFMSNPW